MTTVKNTNVCWLFDLRICMFLKSAVNDAFAKLNLTLEMLEKFHICAVYVHNSDFAREFDKM